MMGDPLLGPEEEELVREIFKLKEEKHALILVHNYQQPNLYRVADFIGDSFDLSQRAQETKAELIIFCGVYFMAETAKILNPRARVLIPNPESRCPMVDMITPERLRRRREELGDVVVVAYVNTSAEVKAEADICCTSANVVEVVRAIPLEKRVLLVPDRNLASWAELQSHREVIPWDGYCYVHEEIRLEDVEVARVRYPGVPIIVHPECRPEVVKAADYVASTSGMVRLASGRRAVILGTEAGMCNRLRREYPGIECHPLSSDAICSDMKRNTLANLLSALQSEKHEVTLPTPVIERAGQALRRMLEVKAVGISSPPSAKERR